MERTQVIIDDNKRAITIRTATGTFTQSGISKPIIDLLNNLEEENKQLKVKSEVLEENNKLLIQQKAQMYEDLDIAYEKIDKAIEYIKTVNESSKYLNSMFLYENYISNYGACELLDILQGNDK